MARPSEYTPEMALVICDRLADGESLRKICTDEAMPGKTTVFRWLGEHEPFRNQYARAREAQADSLADDILSIADDGTNDSYQDDEGNVRTNLDVIARSRLRVDARKWIASKLKPKVYGDKIGIGGADDLPPVQVTQVALVALDALDNSTDQAS